MLYNGFVDIFYALADPTRRRILEMLAENGPMPATDIYAQFPVSPPAISQHLKVLRQAELVLVERRAQQRIYRLNPQAMQELGEWTRHLNQLWEQRFSALDELLELEKKKSKGSAE